MILCPISQLLTMHEYFLDPVHQKMITACQQMIVQRKEKVAKEMERLRRRTGR